MADSSVSFVVRKEMASMDMNYSSLTGQKNLRFVITPSGVVWL